MALLDYTLPTDGLAGSFIDGKWHWPDSGATLTVENPSRREVICQIGRGTSAEVDLAVAAAERARAAWAARPTAERGAMLTELGARLTAHGAEVARLLAAESRNPIPTPTPGAAAGAGGALI